MNAAFTHPVHGPCEVIDKQFTERSKTVLVRTAAGACLYVSTKWLPVEVAATPPSPAELRAEASRLPQTTPDES